MNTKSTEAELAKLYARASELIHLSWSRPLTAAERAEKLELDIILG